MLAALMHVDETCREVLHAIAASPAHSTKENPDVPEMEERLALFRKMVRALSLFRSRDADSVFQMAARTHVAQSGDGEAMEVQMDGWVKLGPGNGWKECPIGYWRG